MCKTNIPNLRIIRSRKGHQIYQPSYLRSGKMYQQFEEFATDTPELEGK